MRLHVHTLGDGDGPPVVCLHGVMGHGGRFRRLADDALGGRRVLALDLRGHGASGWEPPWNLETFLGDVVETLDHAGVTTCDLVGFSFGGRLGLELAAAEPGRVGRLALLDPAIRIDPPLAADLADGIREDVGFASVEAAIDARMAVLRHTPREMLVDDMAEALVTGDDGLLRYRVSRNAVVAAYGEMARPPTVPAATPTLLVRAAEGIVGDTHEDLLRSALGSRLTVVRVPGSHSVLWDAYAATAAAVAEHLGA